MYQSAFTYRPRTVRFCQWSRKAYASAKAREVLGEFPEHMTVWCSGNIIKNVKGVKVPNSGGMKGVEAAAVLGLAGGDPSQALEVLEAVTQTDIKRTKEEAMIQLYLKYQKTILYITPLSRFSISSWKAKRLHLILS